MSEPERLSEEARAREGASRLLAFTDGVMAIAITLLVLDLKAPEVQPARLAAALLAQWPSWLAFALSFFVLGAAWRGHHRDFQWIERVDGTLVRANLIYLFTVTLLPYTTSVMARNPDASLAWIVYALNVLLLGAAAMLYRLAAVRRGLTRGLTGRRSAFIAGPGRAVHAVFLLSIPVALVNVTWAQLTPLLLVPPAFVPRRSGAG